MKTTASENQPQPVSTEEGDAAAVDTIDSSNNDGDEERDFISQKVWRELDGTVVPISSLSNEEILNRMSVAAGKIEKHRRNILSRQVNIIFLSKLSQNLANELRNRDDVPNLLLPEMQFIEEKE